MVLSALLLVLGVWCVHNWRQGDRRLTVLILFFGLLGVSWTVTSPGAHPVDPPSSAPALYRATFDDVPVVRNNRLRCIVRLLPGQRVSPKRVWFSAPVTPALSHAQYGQEVSFEGVLASPEEPLNPGEYDFAQTLRQENVTWMVQQVRGASISISSAPSVNLFGVLVAPLRAWITSALSRELSQGDSAFTEALLFGMPGTLDTATAQAFSLLGVLHVLIASGLKVRMTIEPIERMLSWSKLPRAVQMGMSTGLLCVYLALIGGGVAVWRAVLSAVVARMGQTAGRRASPWTSWGLAAGICAALSPESVATAGYLLSFGVTAGLMLYGARLARKLRGLTGKRFAKPVAELIVAQLVSAPLTASFFHQFSLLSLFANAFLVSALRLFLPLGLILLGLLTVPNTILSTNAAAAWSWGLSALKFPATAAFMHAWGTWYVAGPPTTWIVLYFLTLHLVFGGRRVPRALLFLLSRARRRVSYDDASWRLAPLTAGLATFLLFTALLPARWGSTRIMVTYLSTGSLPTWVILRTDQGTCVLLAPEGGSAATPATVSGVVLPALETFGVNRLNAVVFPAASAQLAADAALIRDALRVDNWWLADARGRIWRSGIEPARDLAQPGEIPLRTSDDLFAGGVSWYRETKRTPRYGFRIQAGAASFADSRSLDGGSSSSRSTDLAVSPGTSQRTEILEWTGRAKARLTDHKAAARYAPSRSLSSLVPLWSLRVVGAATVSVRRTGLTVTAFRSGE